MKKIFLGLMILILVSGCIQGGALMKLESSDLGETIPAKFTCDGENISPALSWSDIPENTKSFALEVRDPDAPMGTFIHWMVFNIPADKISIVQGEIPGKQIINDFGQQGYGGPCPPSGTHRYYFTVYALDVENLGEINNKDQFTNAVNKHMIAKAEIMSKYSRQ